jgi:hypothetical protein
MKPMEIGEFTLGIITNLLSSVIYDGIKSQDYFQRRKIERRVEDATAEIVEPLLPFLRNEGVTEDKQRRLLETCVKELRPLTKNPELLFQGSLNGQKIFEDLYVKRELPQVVVEDGLKDVYTLICPRIATLLCKIPAAVKDWESEAWSENYRRFDEITEQLLTLYHKVDELATSSSQDTDALLTRVRQLLAQKIRFDLDLTGLRGDSPRAGKFDDFFVHPQIREVVKDDKKLQAKVLGNTDESFDLFTIKGQRAILIGQAGAGKSTWAKWLQREALSTRWSGLCIRVELRRFSGELLTPSLHELVREVAGQHLAEELTSDRIGAWLKANKIVFILDGFDEIRPSDRDMIYDWIVDLSPALQSCPFVLTSRPITTDHLERLSENWQPWMIEPFDIERIIDYIQRWYAHMPLLSEGNQAVDAKELAENWRKDPTIEPLTGNPLLLSTLLMVHHLDGSLPSGRSALYQRYVSGMLGLWDDRRQVTATSIQLSLEQKWRIMRGFALRMFLQQKDQIDEDLALETMRELLQSFKISLSEEVVLAGLRERSGLIIGPGVYSFVHKSVLEFLVAESVLQGDQRDESGRRIDRFCLFEHRNDDRWNTVTFLWVGLASVSEVESFIDECIKAKKWDLAYGILYDQYNKFQPEICHRLLLEIICGDQNSISYDKNGMSHFGFPYRRNTFTFPLLTLRGLASSRTTFGGLMLRAIKDGNLSWRDRHNAKGKMRDLLWMYCSLFTFHDIDEWKTCIAEPCPNGNNKQDWINIFAYYLFRQELIKEDLKDLEKVIAFFKANFPHASGLVPITLIYVVCQIFNLDRRLINIKRFNHKHVAFVQVLKILSDSNTNNSEIIKEILLYTREWGPLPDKKAQDLLINFIKEAENLVDAGILEKDLIYERAINYSNPK